MTRRAPLIALYPAAEHIGTQRLADAAAHGLAALGLGSFADELRASPESSVVATAALPHVQGAQKALRAIGAPRDWQGVAETTVTYLRVIERRDVTPLAHEEFATWLLDAPGGSRRQCTITLFGVELVLRGSVTKSGERALWIGETAYNLGPEDDAASVVALVEKAARGWADAWRRVVAS